MAVKIVPFDELMMPAAAHLLAERQRRDRRSLPELPARFEDATAAKKAIAAALERRYARGYAALEGGELVAYLIGDMVIDSVWGRAGWVRSAGCAYEPEVGIEPVRDLYAALGAHWVGYGVFFHFALMAAADAALLQAWFSLSFGIEQVHAIVDLAAHEPAAPVVPAELTVREAGPADGRYAAEMADVIWKTQVQAPVWGVMMPESVVETAEGWAALAEADDVTLWLALQAGEVLGIQAYWPAEATDENLFLPESCIHLSVAGTKEAARGKGIGSLLTAQGLAAARARGYHHCEADWRSTNLLASRFWPRWGFRPVAYRLARRIDTRITWADGSVPA